jgi:iron complex outermembrane receptor protein
MRLKSTLLGGVFALAAITAPLIAYADDAPTEVEGVVVTGVAAASQNTVASSGALGDKPLIDTPYSITVVVAEDLEKRQVNNIAQIFINDPAVFSFATAGTTNWWGTQIRGLGVRNYYVDDVPLLLYWGGDYPLEAVESVQALKGLTGFMYGFGAPGGVISYQTKRPTAEPMLTTEVGWRNSSDLYARVDAGGPVGDGRLGYRVNLAREAGTAYNDAEVDRWLGSLALEYAFAPTLNAYATLTVEDNNLKHEPFQVYWSAFEGTKLPSVTYDYDKLNVDNSYYHSKTIALATGLKWDINADWSARLTYGFTRKLHHSNKMFVDMLNQAGDYDGYVYTFAELDKNHFVQAMTEGRFNTGPIAHEVVAGASYQLSRADFGAGTHWGQDFTGNIHQTQTFLAPTQIDFTTEGYPYEERQTAVFLSDTLHLGPQWQVVLGVRHTRYQIVDVDGDPDYDSRYRANATTPTVAVIYKPAQYVSLYGSYVESMEGGSRVGAEYANFGDILGATVSKQHELGVKYEHNGISVTAAAFRIERANQIDKVVDGLKYLSQDGLSVYEGVEFSGSAQVTDHLRLGVGAIYLDSSIEDVSAGNEDLRGKTPAEAARWQILANADYDVERIRGLSLHGNVRYFGEAPTDDYNTLYMPDRTLVNVGFRYRTVVGGQPVDFTGNVNNLLNQKYWSLGGFGEGVNGSLSVAVHW